MRIAKLAMAAGLLAGLAACGGRQPLKPVPGQPSPAIPVGAESPPTAAQLTEPSVQARPQRNVELLTQSRKRADDYFDLPPEKTP